MQLVPALHVGGVERGTVEIAAALVAAGHEAIVVSGGGRLVNDLHAIGAQHVLLPIGVKRLSSLKYIGKLARLMRDEAVDIVHARSRLPAWLGYWARKRLPAATRPAWITTVHGPYTVNAYSRIMTSGERVIAISEFIREYIEVNYPRVPVANIEVIPRGVDSAEFNQDYRPSAAWVEQFRELLPSIDNRALLVMAGRVTRWKGHMDFLELLAGLRAAQVPVFGLIAGGPSDPGSRFEHELRERIVQLGIQDDVSFLGHRGDMRDVLAIADIAFSLTAEPEAFGRTTIEALSLGTPVVGYDHGGTGEILRTMFPQGLIPCGDIDAARARDHRDAGCAERGTARAPLHRGAYAGLNARTLRTGVSGVSRQLRLTSDRRRSRKARAACARQPIR